MRSVTQMLMSGVEVTADWVRGLLANGGYARSAFTGTGMLNSTEPMIRRLLPSTWWMLIL